VFFNKETYHILYLKFFVRLLNFSLSLYLILFRRPQNGDD
jgi:hypothetical protein